MTDPTIVIQKLLYEHPLYEAVAEGEKEIRVLVIGGGTYSQRFLDLCLQSGQMDGVSSMLRRFRMSRRRSGKTISVSARRWRNLSM